jgi:AcrR family transcriptional regulator
VTRSVAVADSPSRPLRADARRNRDKILAAASAVFGEQGAEASLEEIARRAGVGIGTLYRHFPSRAELLETVYRREVDEVCDRVDDLITTLPPDEALMQWLRRFVAYAATKKGWAGALKTLLGPDTDVFVHSRGRMTAALDRLVTANIEAGLMRADATAEDVLRAVGAFCHVAETPDWEETTFRLAQLFVDGLRYGAPVGR